MKNPYDLAGAELGTREVPGIRDNPTVLGYYKDAGHSWVEHDETPWCAAFMSAMIARAGYENPGTLRARDFESYGEHVAPADAKPGDVCVFSRGTNPKQGHVAFFVRWDGGGLIVLGGNQGDQVSEARYPQRRLVAIRRGPWNIKPPGVLAKIFELVVKLIGGLRGKAA